MNWVTDKQLATKLIVDFRLNGTKIVKKFYKEFPIRNGKIKIQMPCDSIIVDKEGNEFPYMISQSVRNDEKLISFHYIYVVRNKSLYEIVEELKTVGVAIESKPCRICEGGGWTSAGLRYMYKNMYCEI